MMDHTYNGVPVSHMAEEDIHDCLENGICLTSGETMSLETYDWIRMRLEIELLIRRGGMR